MDYWHVSVCDDRHRHREFDLPLRDILEDPRNRGAAANVANDGKPASTQVAEDALSGSYHDRTIKQRLDDPLPRRIRTIPTSRGRAEAAAVLFRLPAFGTFGKAPLLVDTIGIVIAMPRYFFHVQDGENLPDLEGTELVGPEAARHEAVVAAGRMLAEGGKKFWDGDEWTMTVQDEAQAIVCELTFAAKG